MGKCVHKLVNHIPNFYDPIGQKVVYDATCDKCNKVFMTDSTRKYFSFRVMKKGSQCKK